MTQSAGSSQNVALKADKPAQFRQAIAFCCDANYVAFAAHAAAQIRQTEGGDTFDICFCYGQGEIALPPELDALDIRLCHVDVGDSFEGLRLDKGRTHDVYLRIALPTAFAEDYDRILYLDSDIFVQGGDFAALLNVDISPHCIAAVRDHIQWRTPNRQNQRNKIKGVPDSAYFNAGIMLMDVKAYTEQALMPRCIEFGRAYRDQLKRHDQNLYNAVLQNDWAELSPMWNWQFSWTARLFATLYSPHILHFIGPVKPWKDPTGQFEPRFAHSFRRFCAQHFPDWTAKFKVGPGLTPDSTRMTKMLIRHFLSRRKMARYLARFPNDLTVHR